MTRGAATPARDDVRRIRCLVIDDDAASAELLRDALERMHRIAAEVEWKPDYRSGLRAASEGGHDVVVVDYLLDGSRTGLDLLEALGGPSAPVPVVLVTGTRTLDRIDLDAAAAGAVDFVDKSEVEPRTLERTIGFAIERHRLHRSLEAKLDAAARQRRAALNLLQDLEDANRERSTSEASLARAHDALERKNRAIVELVGRIDGPDSPLAALREAAAALLEQVAGATDAEAEIAGRVDAAAAGLQRTIAALRELATLEPLAMPLESVRAVDLVARALDELDADARGRVQGPGAARGDDRITGDAGMLVHATSRLLDQMLHVPGAGDVVRIEADATDAEVVVRAIAEGRSTDGPAWSERDAVIVVADWIAQVHGGTLVVGSGDDVPSIELRLPRTEPEAGDRPRTPLPEDRAGGRAHPSDARPAPAAGVTDGSTPRAPR